MNVRQAPQSTFPSLIVTPKIPPKSFVTFASDDLRRSTLLLRQHFWHPTALIRLMIADDEDVNARSSSGDDTDKFGQLDVAAGYQVVFYSKKKITGSG